MKNPCIDCTDKVEDNYGLLCDLVCGKHTAYVNYQTGVKEVVEWIKQFGGLANKIEGEDPEYGHQIQYWACRDNLSPKEYRELKTIYRFVIEMSYDDWQAKLKEWGIEQLFKSTSLPDFIGDKAIVTQSETNKARAIEMQADVFAPSEGLDHDR